MSWIDKFLGCTPGPPEPPPPPKHLAPPRTEEMIANHQVWVGMNYPDGSHGWEIRGTGVIIDEDLIPAERRYWRDNNKDPALNDYEDRWCPNCEEYVPTLDDYCQECGTDT